MVCRKMEEDVFFFAPQPLPSRTPSATCRLLGRTWRSKPHSKRNLEPLG